ncbi:MAG: thymidine phosphorylase [Acidobacteriota bacterium]|jgi:pyrimidine-nucleoside phosphorylase|nr:thymidine phosphorylase [Acidobacteriota bacterium]MDQ3372850.1 thymidine phosphorylase [Acidobacteriota bacterium]
MRPQEIIANKRDGQELSQREIEAFVNGVTNETWADYQISALLMAIFLRGFSLDEQNNLTKAMLESGDSIDFSDIDAPKADKHSTGGVGDKTSLIIAPMVAACGVSVPMISGRGLGHTGGTLDKLESIVGYNVNLTTEQFKQVIKSCGFAMSGQTKKLVPADRKLYALRDATATVESVPLIVSSVMSKKLVEGLDALVLDVKTGSGAFMQKSDDAKNLAAALVKTGNAFGVKTEAVISDMNQPLGKFVGNALEVFECIKILRGEIDASMSATLELSIELSARMLVLCGVVDTIQDSRFKIQDSLESGKALEKFRQNIELQNGNPNICDKPENLLDKSLIKIEIKAKTAGFVTEIDATAIGEAVSKIGGGRIKIEDKIDFAVGFECVKKLSDKLETGETMGFIFCRNQNQADLVYQKLVDAYKIRDEKPKEKFQLIKKII